MSRQSRQKIAVIGRGMIGSSAARHLAKSGQNVTLIGPSEPIDFKQHDGVFGSHYDEGRITRLLDPHPVWEDLAAKSIDRYAQIEAESGISFFREAGVLIGAPEGSDYLQNIRKVREANKIASHELSGKSLRDAFPYLNFDRDMVMLNQHEKAGYISPRRLVQAQTKAAQRYGAKIIDDHVTGIEGHRVKTRSASFSFDRILIACGAYSNSLLDGSLELKPLARTITFFELEEDEVRRLSGMPSIIYRVKDGSDPYVLPPITYPDGKTYLKIGGEPEDSVLSDPQEMNDWFKTSGNTGLKSYMTERINQLLPGLRFRSIHTQACIVTYTSTSLPYIGRLVDHIAVATGGCGGAAKSCDEIGRIAGETLLGHTDARFEMIKMEEKNNEQS